MRRRWLRVVIGRSMIACAPSRRCTPPAPAHAAPVTPPPAPPPRSRADRRRRCDRSATRREAGRDRCTFDRYVRRRAHHRLDGATSGSARTPSTFTTSASARRRSRRPAVTSIPTNQAARLQESRTARISAICRTSICRRQACSASRFFCAGVTLKGPNGLLDADGASIVVHATRDDYITDPAGNSGGRIACGVIVQR